MTHDTETLIAVICCIAVTLAYVIYGIYCYRNRK